MTAAHFLDKLIGFQKKTELKKVQQFFSDQGVESKFLGIRMANIFALAKQFIQMSLKEIERLIESKIYEARLGAVSIMDFQARSKITLGVKLTGFQL